MQLVYDGAERIAEAFWGVDTAFPYTFSNGYTVNAQWVGYFLHEGAREAPPVVTRLGHRHWVDGFEVPQAFASIYFTRDSSRTPDGMGFAYRTHINEQISHPKPASTRESWERLYIRLRTLPAGGDDNFWGANGSASANPIALLNVDSSGQIIGYNWGSGVYPGLLIGNSPALVVGRWYRLDLQIAVIAAGTYPAAFVLYIDGSPSTFGVVPGSQGLTSTQFHASSYIGARGSAVTHGLEMDIDDWVSASPAASAVSPNLGPPGFDLTSGSHVRLLYPTAFATGHDVPSWTGGVGDWRSLETQPVTTSVGITASAPSVKAKINTDYVDLQQGCPAFHVHGYVTALSNSTMQLGYSLNEASEVLTNITTAVGTIWVADAGGQPPIYTIPDGTPLPLLPLGTLQLAFVKHAVVANVSVLILLAQAEFMGTWGVEDIPGLAYPPPRGIHNGPYLRESDGVMSPAGIVAVQSGTYLGDSTGHDLNFAVPIHWLWVRPIGLSGIGGFVWISSNIATHSMTDSFWTPDRLQRMFRLGNVRAHIANKVQESNQAGIVYQYVAVSDPAARYLLNGAFRHKIGTASAPNPLFNTSFTPEAAFCRLEGQSLGGTSGNYYKGPGHATDAASASNAAEAASVLTFATGSITSKTLLHAGHSGCAYSLWRRDDGTGQTGWFDVTSYVGDGVGTLRSIPVRLNGLPPGIFAMVVPHDGAAYVRDPGHTGLQSFRVQIFGNVTNGITDVSRADILGVGTALNTLNVTYDVFVIGGTNGLIYMPPIFPPPLILPPPPQPGPCIAPADAPVTSGQGCVTVILP